MTDVDYDEASRILRIRFVEGGRYRYHDVPPEIAAGLLQAESHGRYFHEHILDRYRYEREPDT